MVSHVACTAAIGEPSEAPVRRRTNTPVWAFDEAVHP
jgi:hypothetical protein